MGLYMIKDHCSTRDRLNNPEVKAKLDAWKEKQARKEQEEIYADIFKNIGYIGEEEFNELKSHFNALVGKATADNSGFAFIIPIQNMEKNSSGSAINNEVNVKAIRKAISVYNNRNSKGSRFWNADLKDTPEKPVFTSGLTNKSLSMEEAQARLKAKLGDAIIPSRLGAAFYTKIWFKVGIPSALTFIASFAEIWRAFH